MLCFSRMLFKAQQRASHGAFVRPASAERCWVGVLRAMYGVPPTVSPNEFEARGWIVVQPVIKHHKLI